jgi:sugar phosphate isomerase/epimerase
VAEHDLDAAVEGLVARRGGGGGGGGRRGRGEQTPEQQAAARAAVEENRKWRTSVSLDRVRDVKRKFDNAGILVEIIKWDGLPAMADDELDYVFQVSKAMGAKALSAELSLDLAKRIGPFADKHQLPFGFHGHAQGPDLFEQVIAMAKYNWINLDIGHFLASHGTPIPFLKKHHARITHIHVKDRKANGGDTVPFGEGDTPVVEVLRLMRDNKWPFQATIEFEYSVPAGSDRITELKKTVEYCRRALVG